MTAEILTTSAQLLALRADWTALLREAETATPFLMPEWVIPWWDTLGHGHELAVVTIRDSGTLVGLVPFMRTQERHARLPVVILQFLGTPLADRMDVLAAPGHLETVVSAAFDALTAAPFSWDLLRLREVPSYSPSLPVLRAQVAARGWASSERECAFVPVMSVAKTYEALRPDFGRHIRKKMNNTRNQLLKRGEVTCQRELVTRQALGAVLEEIARVERASWKGAAGVGIFSSPEQERFFRTALPDMADAGAVDLALLHVDGALVAYHLGLRWADRYYSYNLAHDTAWDGSSPGTVLMDHIIRDSADHTDLQVIDASRSLRTHPHIIARWSETYHTHTELTLYPRTLYARGLYALYEHVGPRLRTLRRRDG